MLVFVASGGFHESGGARPRDLDEATLVYRPPGEPHINRFSGSGATCLIVEISPDWLGDAAAEGPWPDGVVFRKRGRASFLGRRLMHEWAFQDLLSPLAAEGFVLSLIEDLTRADPVTRGAPPAWLDHAEEIMRTRIRQPLSLGEIAAAVGVHHVTLARQFRSHHGCTVGEYLRAVRVETAARQLVNSTKSLTDIAHSTGFCDQSHMTRVVQRSLGLTPGRLRAEATGSPSNGSVP
jgi:AraC family transcriptional regulator